MSTAIESAGHTQPLSVEGYRHLIGQIREATTRCVAPDAVVAVVSRGDEELLRLGGRRACHFPLDADGDYAGYHPASGADAVAHLQELRAAGIDHLLIPRTAFWWLDHYSELAHHLATRWKLLSGENGACRIYGTPGARAPEPRRPGEAGTPVVQLLVGFLDSILPPDAAVAVPGGGVASALAPLRPGTVAVPTARSEVWGGSATALLDELPALADYLFLPAAEVEETPERRRLLGLLDARFPTLAIREALGVLFDLRFPVTTDAS